MCSLLISPLPLFSSEQHDCEIAQEIQEKLTIEAERRRIQEKKDEVCFIEVLHPWERPSSAKPFWMTAGLLIWSAVGPLDALCSWESLDMKY